MPSEPRRTLPLALARREAVPVRHVRLGPGAIVHDPGRGPYVTVELVNPLRHRPLRRAELVDQRIGRTGHA